MPGLNMTDVGPDRNDPFPNRSFADIVTSVDEAPTGRFMLGVAASSFQGLFGNFTVYEKNFDIWNFPRSFNDIFNGTAWRGAGQEFRIDLQPGTNINRFQVSLREPYLFDLPIGAGAAATGSPVFIPTGTSGAAVPGSRWDASLARASMPIRRCVAKTLTSSASKLRRRRRTWLPAESRSWPRYAQHPVRQPQQPVSGHQGSVRRVLLRAGMGHIHLDQVRRRGADVLHHRQPPGRHRKAVLHPAEPLRYRDPGNPGLRKLLRR